MCKVMYIMSWHDICFASQITTNITQIITTNNYWSKKKFSCNCNEKKKTREDDHFTIIEKKSVQTR